MDIYLPKPFNALVTASLLLSLFASSAARADEAACAALHDSVIHDALAATFNAANLNLVERASESQCKPGSEASTEPQRHFSNPNFSKALAYMDRQKRLILDFSASADTNPMDRARALYHLGLLLHTAQDFYSHTNYIELAAQKVTPTTTSSKDPYALELVDWTKLATVRTNQLQTSPEIYKDDPNGAEAKIAFGSSNYFKVAKELAVKETVRQWNSVEALIKLKHAGKANEIISAMKEASCPYIKDLDKLPEEEI
ncbi:MAG TPA: hypothetical protein V6C76_17475 [Drouetiella sp.]